MFGVHQKEEVRVNYTTEQAYKDATEQKKKRLDEFLSKNELDEKDPSFITKLQNIVESDESEDADEKDHKETQELNERVKEKRNDFKTF